MSSLLLVVTWLAPLAVLPLALGRGGRWWTPLAVLPALGAVLFTPVGTEVEVPWLLLGVQLGLDATARVFLVFTAILWLSAALYASLQKTIDPHAVRFRVFFLLAMSGNLLLILAADMVTFYLGFALMGLAAYGLIRHRPGQCARRAARVYLAWTLVGELALFSAVVLLASGGDSLGFSDLGQRELPAAAVTLLLLGFGIKLAMPGLHVWLPLAYRAAPPAAAAVLSGPMISAGLLGWLRFLPPGAPGLAGWSDLLWVLGITGVALGVLVGSVQRDPRAVLGYSSIAKTGLIGAAYGAALAHPAAAPGILAALLAFAMHHLLVKGALFLGVGEWERAGGRSWVIAGLVVLSLALAGAPLSGGAAAKTALGDALAGAGLDCGLLFLLSGTGTVLLMTRFLWLVRGVEAGGPAQGFSAAALAWVVLALSATWLPVALVGVPLSTAGLAPLALGLPVAFLVALARRRRFGPHFAIPPGDLLHLLPIGRLYRVLRTRRRRTAGLKFAPYTRAAAVDVQVMSFATAGLLWLSVFLFVLGALLWR